VGPALVATGPDRPGLRMLRAAQKARVPRGSRALGPLANPLPAVWTGTDPGRRPARPGLSCVPAGPGAETRYKPER
jgi:hypothetical protein